MEDMEDEKLESQDSIGNEKPLLSEARHSCESEHSSIPSRKKKLSETFSTDSESSKLLYDEPISSSSVGRNNNTIGCEERKDSSSSISKRTRHGDHGPSGSYNFKRKFNFRSDSVYSDVTPVSASNVDGSSGNVGSAEPLETTGSLPSLKNKGESKWVSLKKKLGKLNSSKKQMIDDSSGPSTNNAIKVGGSTGSVSQPMKEKKQLSHNKRSLLQRAKTLAILPVQGSRSTKDGMGESSRSSSRKGRTERPPELFNVGGEMNLIPLELLIDINDLNISK